MFYCVKLSKLIYSCQFGAILNNAPVTIGICVFREAWVLITLVSVSRGRISVSLEKAQVYFNKYYQILIQSGYAHFYSWYQLLHILVKHCQSLSF